MKTYLDCIPCFFKQALEAARLAGADETTIRQILNELARRIPDDSLDGSPPEMGRLLYRLVRDITGIPDPFKKLKDNSNRLSLELYPELKRKVLNSTDRLLTAIRIAVAGNIIDYGARANLVEGHSLDVTGVIEDCLVRDFAIFDYQEFKKCLTRARQILYLADNAGEVAFDRILIEQLNKKVIYAVRGEPIINDATLEDARFCGMEREARLISSGSDAPGAVLKFCTPEFVKTFKQADMIISKGQGNFEALTEENRNIFFLFKVKCPVMARNIGCQVGDIVLKRGAKKPKR